MTTNRLTGAPEPLRRAVVAGRVGAVVRFARKAAGLTQRELGDLCGGYGQSTISRIEDGKTTNPSPSVLRRIADVTGIPTEWLGLASSPLQTDREKRHTNGGTGSADEAGLAPSQGSAQSTAGELARSAQLAVDTGDASGIASDLAGLMAQLEDSSTSDAAVDRLSYLTAALAESHTQAPARSVLDQVLRLHGQAKVMLAGRLRLAQRRHLYRIESELLAHACLLLGDLGNDDLADRYGIVALRYAEEAGSNEALACTALAKTYRWQNRLFESAEIARRGYERSPEAPVRVQLAAQEANAAALFGDVGRAREAMGRAERDAETVADSGVSAWSFARGRQAVFALSVASQTRDLAGALRAVSLAEEGWASGEPRVAANWAQVRIGAAIVHLRLGALDAAVADVEPVLTLDPELRIATVTAYTRAVDRQLGGARYRDSRPAQELQQKVREFNAAALPGKLPKASDGW